MNDGVVGRKGSLSTPSFSLKKEEKSGIKIVRKEHIMSTPAIIKRPKVRISNESCLDHSLMDVHLSWLMTLLNGSFDDYRQHVQALNADADSNITFMIVSLEVPISLPDMYSQLRGPEAGDQPIYDDSPGVTFKPRVNRTWNSKMIDLPRVSTRCITAIIGKNGDGDLILYSAYAGRYVPQEPGDIALVGNEDALNESKSFWKVHALAARTVDV